MMIYGSLHSMKMNKYWIVILYISTEKESPKKKSLLFLKLYLAYVDNILCIPRIIFVKLVVFLFFLFEEIHKDLILK